MKRFSDIINKAAKLYGDREAVVFEGTRLSYNTLNTRVNKLANYLVSLNLPGAKHVAVLAENCHQYLEVYFAAAKSGHVVTPLNYRLSVGELIEIIKNAESKMLFYGQGYGDIAREIAAQTGIDKLVCIESAEHGSNCYEDLIAAFTDTEPTVEVGENQLVVLMYTGGTTGKAKGVVISHRNLLIAALSSSLQFKFSSRDSTLLVLPMFHIAFWSIYPMMLAGGRVVIQRVANLTQTLELIQSEKCTHINAIPTLYNWMLQRPDIDTFDLSTLKSITYGGSPIAPELLKKLVKKFGNIMVQIYGATESAGPLTYLQPEDHVVEVPAEISRRLNSVGKECMLAELKVLNEKGQKVAPGEVGEIIAKGEMIMLRYWKDPEQTSEALRDGWYYTGDMATVDEHGYIYLVDRKKDMIITGGENVYPREVEDVLYEHPAVMEAAVISVPDEKWGEAVKAVIVLKEGLKADEQEIIQFTKSRLAGYKSPKTVEFKDSLPKSTVGKILRSELKKQYWKGKDRLIN